MQSFDLKEKSIYLHNSLFLVTIKYGNNSYYKSHIVNILFLHIFQKVVMIYIVIMINDFIINKLFYHED